MFEELYPISLFSTFGWPLEETISHEQHCSFRDGETPESFTHFPPSQPDVRQLDRSTSFTAHSGSGDPSMVKKLNHNASERDRRKKINSLYSSLRSLLPAADRRKKLSIPCTVSRVIEYIPQLQQEVERLIQMKEELLSKLSRQADDLTHQENQRKGTMYSSLSSVSASRLSDREVAVQISTNKLPRSPLSEILVNLEEAGLLLINSSFFESLGGRVFYNLHLQAMEGTYTVECEALNERLVSLCEKRESLFPLNSSSPYSNCIF
ncbi:PREDICTED: transcription factor ORG2-like [Populus euphratica]|uniref:Transcription factor ORG2-like n=1 Tax=Populus euphratica TaxID=75702 RepID=A0AAJ6WZQ2_POPEU|nr:PREDICTED: transcription factor ORG2-like [Populus euphratica]